MLLVLIEYLHDMKIQQLFDGLEYYRLKRYSDKINANTKKVKKKRIKKLLLKLL